MGVYHLKRQGGFEKLVTRVQLVDEGVVHIHCSGDDIAQEEEVAEGQKRRDRIHVELRF